MIQRRPFSTRFALNETALHSDTTYAKQLKAGAILEEILAKLPDHPGALHYLIHTYDYPPLAQRALDAANKYADVAPASSHAQHMPYARGGGCGGQQRKTHRDGEPALSDARIVRRPAA
jgi:hypothetical protein